MRVRAKRGRDFYLVEKDGVFYLANLVINEALELIRAPGPAFYTKAGYWEDDQQIDEAMLARIQEALQHIREV